MDIVGVKRITHNENKEKSHWRIYFDVENSFKMFTLIAPYVPTCMRYKLPEGFRHYISTFNPPTKSYYENRLKPYKVRAKHILTKKTMKYDLETITNNYCVNGIWVHNSQCQILRGNDGKRYVTSKGFAGKQQVIKESDTNAYWQAVKNCEIFEKLDSIEKFKGVDVQLVGELIPCQGANYSYNLERPEIRIFSSFLVEEELSWDGMNEHFASLKDYFVPLLYRGPFKKDMLPELAKGMETVSGKQKNIREGIVVSPLIPRKSSKGFRLLLKVINPKYRDDDDAFS